MKPTSAILACLMLVFACVLCIAPEALWNTRKAGAATTAQEQPWRIRFLEAAVIRGDRVLLGEVAVPLGDMPSDTWRQLATRELWPSPPAGKAFSMTRPRLQEAVMHTMRDLAPYCLFPGAMALQRGGVLVGKEAIHQLVEKELGPYLASLPGETTLRDFRLPQQIFLEHTGQMVTLDVAKKVAPGRQSLRLVVRDMDGSIRQKLTGSVFIDCWMDVPCAAVVLNREDLLDHTKVTHKRVNLANLRGEPWDGTGGPWRLVRPVGPEQVIYKSDVAHIPTVRKGGVVTLLYEGQRVRLTVQAEAMADGSAGESILVRNLQSKKEVYAVVRDSGTVIVVAMP